MTTILFCAALVMYAKSTRRTLALAMQHLSLLCHSHFELPRLATQTALAKVGQIEETLKFWATDELRPRIQAALITSVESREAEWSFQS